MNTSLQEMKGILCNGKKYKLYGQYKLLYKANLL